MKIRLLQLIIFLISSILEVKVATAQERFEFFNGVRQLGMGGASIGVVNDETSLLSNPNGLGKIRDSIITLIDPELSISGDFVDFILDGGNPLDYFELEGIKDSLAGTSDSHLHSKLQIFPSAVFTNFGIGMFKKYSFDAHSSTDGTAMDFHYYDDTAVLLGYNFRLFQGRIKLGITGKYINRGYASDQVTLATSSIDVDDYITEGVAIGADIGLTLSAPWDWLPSLTAVIRDAGRTKFTTSGGMFYNASQAPASIPQTIDAAFSIFPIHTNKVRSSFTVELKDIENVYEEDDWQRRAHAGWELNMHDTLFFRAGMNQHYWTAGLEIASQNTQIQLATYGEDVGPDNDPKEDRRYVVKFAFRF